MTVIDKDPNRLSSDPESVGARRAEHILGYLDGVIPANNTFPVEDHEAEAESYLVPWELNANYPDSWTQHAVFQRILLGDDGALEMTDNTQIVYKHPNGEITRQVVTASDTPGAAYVCYMALRYDQAE